MIEPDWSKVCDSPELHDGLHIYLTFDDFDQYWCKLCSMSGMPISTVNKKQLKLFEFKKDE